MGRESLKRQKTRQYGSGSSLRGGGGGGGRCEDRRLDSRHCGPGTGLYLTGLVLGS